MAGHIPKPPPLDPALLKVTLTPEQIKKFEDEHGPLPPPPGKTTGKKHREGRKAGALPPGVVVVDPGAPAPGLIALGPVQPVPFAAAPPGPAGKGFTPEELAALPPPPPGGQGGLAVPPHGQRNFSNYPPPPPQPNGPVWPTVKQIHQEGAAPATACPTFVPPPSDNLPSLPRHHRTGSGWSSAGSAAGSESHDRTASIQECTAAAAALLESMSTLLDWVRYLNPAINQSGGPEQRPGVMPSSWKNMLAQHLSQNTIPKSSWNGFLSEAKAQQAGFNLYTVRSVDPETASAISESFDLLASLGLACKKDSPNLKASLLADMKAQKAKIDKSSQAYCDRAELKRARLPSQRRATSIDMSQSRGANGNDLRNLWSSLRRGRYWWPPNWYGLTANDRSLWAALNSKKNVLHRLTDQLMYVMDHWVPKWFADKHELNAKIESIESFRRTWRSIGHYVDNYSAFKALKYFTPECLEVHCMDLFNLARSLREAFISARRLWPNRGCTDLLKSCWLASHSLAIEMSSMRSAWRAQASQRSRL